MSHSTFHFTIRDVLWLTTIVALGAGWFVHWASARAKYDALLKQHVQMLTKQSDASMAGSNQMFADMRQRGDLQRQIMEEKKKNMNLKVELSTRLQQELQKARRLDADKAKAQTEKKAEAAAPRDKKD